MFLVMNNRIKEAVTEFTKLNHEKYNNDPQKLYEAFDAEDLKKDVPLLAHNLLQKLINIDHIIKN